MTERGEQPKNDQIQGSPEKRSQNAWGINQKSAKENSIVKKMRLREENRKKRESTKSSVSETNTTPPSQDSQEKS